VSRVRGELFQWFALLGGALAWTAQLVVGVGITVARCGGGGDRLGIDYRTWQIAAMVAAAVVVLLAEGAAIALAVATWELEEDGPPPGSRRHFFALAAVLGNVLFLGAVVMGGIGAVSHSPCQGA
jgi:hypothetical protein